MRLSRTSSSPQGGVALNGSPQLTSLSDRAYPHLRASEYICFPFQTGNRDKIMAFLFSSLSSGDVESPLSVGLMFLGLRDLMWMPRAFCSSPT